MLLYFFVFLTVAFLAGAFLGDFLAAGFLAAGFFVAISFGSSSSSVLEQVVVSVATLTRHKRRSKLVAHL